MHIKIFSIPKLKTHKEESEFCRTKLLEICQEQYGLSIDISEICKDEKGKPYFKNSDVHFNISHSRGMGAIVVSDKPCGVDIEQKRVLKHNVAERFFADEEKKWINASRSDEEKNKRFFKVWTAKEAYTKMLGCGLTEPLDSYNVLDNDISRYLKYYEEDNYIICSCEKIEV